MRRHWPGRRKLVHVDASMCADMSSTADGTKCLREPMLTSTSDYKTSCGLLPRPSRKSVGSCNHTSQLLGTSESGCSCVNVDGTSDAVAYACKQGQLTEMDVDDNDGDSVSGSSQPKCSIEFVTARKYMNPTFSLLENNNAPQNTVEMVHQITHGSVQVNRPGRKPNSRLVATVQSNSLDRYFKPVSVSKPSTAATFPQSHTAWSAEHSAVCSVTPENSPQKSVLSSPVSKFPGSDTIYICSPSSQSSRSCDSATSSQSSSCARNVFKDHKNFASALSSDANDVDFEASFNCVWKTDPGIKRKSAEQSGHSSKKQAVSLDMSAESFGLFGFSNNTLQALDSDTDFEEDTTEYFSKVPREVVSNILCRIPHTDLCLNVNRVCVSWKNIIDSDDFMPWKKRYNCLLKNDAESMRIMLEHMKLAKMLQIDLYLPALIRYMKTYKPKSGLMLDKPLQKHHLYPCARSLLVERFPDLIQQGKVVSLWCMVAVIVLLAESVRDISEILRYLLGCKSQCTAEELLDCLYCIASFLLTFKSLRRNDVWTNMHYRLYYALYLYENDVSLTTSDLSCAFQSTSGQQSIRKYGCSDANLRLTHEQLRICNYNTSPGEVVKIVAFAGTGKTTTLLEYARLRPHLKFLLVVYNKSVAENAKGRFPSHVDCSTSHSLAYRALGWKYANADKLGGNMRVNDVVQLVDMRKGISVYVQAKLVVDTLHNYMSSAEELITTKHVPEMRKDKNGDAISLDHADKMNLANDAEKIWRKMVDLNNKRIRLPHDGYLKLWQLKRPQLDKYDVLMIDEAQDLTPAVADIFKRQMQARIMVGDPHQQIYGFRGAINAMDLVQATRTFYLTQSFRFGPEISAIAAFCLEVLKKEDRKILVGSGVPDGVDGDQVGQLAVITRTNFQLFAEAITRCVYSDSSMKVAFAGGVEGFGFDMIQDIYVLMIPASPREKHAEIRNGLIRSFIDRGGFAELDDYANQTDDKELLSKILIVKTYGAMLSSHIPRIKSKCIRDILLADVVLSTAHKAKGLEFDTVQLTDDFMHLNEHAPAAVKNWEDECNLLYVAITRAKKRLQMSQGLYKLLKQYGERFYRLVPPSGLLKDGKTQLVCCMRGTEFEPQSTVVLCQRRLTLSNGSAVGGGVFSADAAASELSSIKYIVGDVCPDADVNADDVNDDD